MLLLVILSLFIGIWSQVEAQEDSTYYISYKKKLTTRLYTSRKYTSLVIIDHVDDTRIRFEPNSTLNLGVGATYNDFTLNLAYGFRFMNPIDVKGRTRYLDLQAIHISKELGDRFVWAILWWIFSEKYKR